MPAARASKAVPVRVTAPVATCCALALLAAGTASPAVAADDPTGGTAPAPAPVPEAGPVARPVGLRRDPVRRGRRRLPAARGRRPRRACVDGLAAAPADAPPAVQEVVWAANRIVGLPYRWGGGHRRGFDDTAYDCSGSVSYALAGALLLQRPLASPALERWGRRGRGAWVTVYANASHAFLQVAGLRLDTSAAGDPGGRRGVRWRPVRTATRGFRARHPAGL